MAGRIRSEDIALVRERSPIDQIVGEHLQLRSAGGGSLKGLCPFHDEKTPSFNITPAKGLWFCHGCGIGGDVIEFVMRIEHLTFAEAVERLAARANIQLNYEAGGYVPARERGERSRLIEAHQAAAEFYMSQLESAEASAARVFLAERGFERGDAEHFGCGFAPPGWDALSRHLLSRGFTSQEIIKGGLAREGRRGPVDRFRGRLVWPIKDLTGEVIGFGARKLLDGDDGPKYLNTPESPIYKKSTVLYGVDLAKRDIARRQQAVIVEGYTDVMAAHLAGVTTAIATCGTSFGDEHIKVLRRLLMDSEDSRGEVIFTFDGDSAGQKAALRAFADEQKFATQTCVAIQPDGFDPCDLRIKHGDAAVRDLIAARVPLFEFAIRSVIGRYDLDSVDGRMNALEAAAPIVAKIKDKSRRQAYAVQLDRWLGFMNESFVLERVAASGGSSSRRAPAEQRPARQAAGRELNPMEVEVERETLKLAIQEPALLGPAYDALPDDVFTHPGHVAVHGLITEAGGVGAAGAGGREWAERLREAASAAQGGTEMTERLRNLVTRLAVEPPRGAADERYAAELLARVEELSVTRRLTVLKSRLQRVNPVEEPEDYNRLFGELVALEQHRRVLRERAQGNQ